MKQDRHWIIMLLFCERYSIFLYSFIYFILSFFFVYRNSSSSSTYFREKKYQQGRIVHRSGLNNENNKDENKKMSLWWSGRAPPGWIGNPYWTYWTYLISACVAVYWFYTFIWLYADSIDWHEITDWIRRT